MTQTEFEKIVDRALSLVPQVIREAMDNMAIIIEERPSADDLEEVGLSAEDYLFGLFRGIPITERSFFAPGGNLPHQIVLFKGELEEACRSRRELVDQITLTLVHEVGHYLGLDEEELRELERQAVYRIT